MTETLNKSLQDQAQEMIQLEAQALLAMAEGLDGSFDQAVKMIHDCQGSIVLTGIGKAGIIGQKISSTLASTGTPSHFLHAAEAVHGDLGRLRAGDIAIVLSHSGESEETVRLIALLKQLDIPMIGITGKLDSSLGKHSQVTLNLGQYRRNLSAGPGAQYQHDLHAGIRRCIGADGNETSQFSIGRLRPLSSRRRAGTETRDRRTGGALYQWQNTPGSLGEQHRPGGFTRRREKRRAAAWLRVAG